MSVVSFALAVVFIIRPFSTSAFRVPKARSLIFDLSSLSTSLLAGECSSSCALSLSSSWPGLLPRTPYCIDFSIQHSSRISLSASFLLQHSLSPCDHCLCHLIDSLVRQRRKHSFIPWKISKSANALFRFPTTSGWLLPETTLRFFSCTGKDTLLPR